MREEPGAAVIDVEDNGKGLPSEDREKLLEPYMTTREKGTGLGLAIVRKIMEEHGGSIALLDARAVAERPARRADAADLSASRRSRRTSRRAKRRANERPGRATMAADILVVDDEADIREIVAGILEDEGHAARTASDSDSALAAIGARRPSLLFLDIWLQGSRLDGLSLLDEVHRAASRSAGRHHLRPRQHRDRRLRHQARRLRLHREAVQGRPPGARRASARSKRRSCGARSPS